jgi:hypothetical protein
MQSHLTTHLPTPITRLRWARTFLASALILAPATALAQAAEQPVPPPPPPPEAPPQPETPPTPPPETAPPPSEAAGPEQRLQAVETELEGMRESYPALVGDVAALKRIKVSGYVQGRYEWTDDADFGVDARGRARGKNRFLVRRGRLKTTYTGDLSEFMLQIDAASDNGPLPGGGVLVKDAEASLVLNETVIPTPTAWELKLTLGQFKVPFGYEVVQSSSDREMPERTGIIRDLFPGERDRGLRLTYRWEWLRVATAIINGNYTNDAIHGGFDQSSFKDVVARVGADLDFIVFGASLQWGHDYRVPTPPAGMTNPPNTYNRFNRLRFGGDAQFYQDVGIGGLAVKAEIIWANDDNLEFSGVAADDCKDIKTFGWWAQVSQNFGDHMGAAFRMDQFDPNSGLGDGCSGLAASKEDKVTGIGGALLIYVSGNLKATLAYQHFGEQGTRKVGNDIFTTQLQAKF